MSKLWQGVRITAGDYRATIDPRGASLAELTYRGVPLTRAYTPTELRPAYSGASLAPWPNRVVDGTWDDRGTARQLPITEVERHHALHGLIADTIFHVAETQPACVQLAAAIPATDGYPYPLDVRATFTLADSGLCWQLRAASPVAGAPIGLGVHPYLCVGDGEVDHWQLRANVAQMLTARGERLLPGELQSPPAAWDFASGPKLLAGQVIDHAFALSGPARATLSNPAGGQVCSAVTITADANWLQIYTCDAPGAAKRKFVAIEPQTCAPNALANMADPQLGLPRLQAGEAASLRVQICAD